MRFRCFYDLKQTFPGLPCTLNPRRNLAIPHFPGAKSIYKAVGYIDIDRVHVYFMPGRAQLRTANKQTIYCLRLLVFFLFAPLSSTNEFPTCVSPLLCERQFSSLCDLYFFFVCASDSGDPVRRRGGVDSRRAPGRGEGGRGRAGGVRPAPPHLPPPGRRAGAERRAAALRDPSGHQAAGPAPLLARGEGKG